MTTHTWGGWVADGTFTSTLTNGTAQIGDAKTLSGKGAIEVGVSITYGATVSNGGVLLQVLRKVDATNYEDANSAPRAYLIPAVSATTVRKGFVIDGSQVSEFKIRALMPTGNTNGTSFAVNYRERT